MNTQLTFGLMSGEEKFVPYAVGDVVVKHNGRRYVITATDNADGPMRDACDQPVFVGVALDTGTEGVILQREIAYRSK